jgi:hypothetical protein
MHISSISLADFQIIFSLLMAFWVVVPAWLAYRELVRSEVTASIAVLILLIQPEFLFPLLRGSHEKFTRGLMFICLYLLMRSLRSKSARKLTLLAINFYICAYAMITFNTFLATSYILALIISLGLLWVGKHRFTDNRENPVETKLLYVTSGLLIIAFLFTFYAYPPATHQLRIFQNVWDQISILLLQVEEVPISPYQAVNAGWISLPVYFIVSIANWLLLGLSFVIWTRNTYTWFIKRVSQPEIHELTLWALYAAFAFLGAVSIVVDVSGAIANNLQHRMFPSFAMIASPVVGLWLTSLKSYSQSRNRLFQTSVGIILAGLMVLGILKATNEPLLSNNWVFYTQGEMASINWAEQKLIENTIWVGSSSRLANGFILIEGKPPDSLILDVYQVESDTRNYLSSETIELFAIRTNQSLPIQADDFITYDNGEAQIYHRRPLTPFQK